MALAQLLQESAGLTAKSEIQCAQSGCPGQYETPGCDADGKDYYGRGYIQLTWCANYKAASQDLLGDTSLVTNPDSVATDENLSWNTAFWFWKVQTQRPQLQQIQQEFENIILYQVNVHAQPGVSDGNFGATTKAINGDLECGSGPNVATAHTRFAIYGKVRAAFSLAGAGNESGCYN